MRWNTPLYMPPAVSLTKAYVALILRWPNSKPSGRKTPYLLNLLDSEITAKHRASINVMLIGKNLRMLDGRMPEIKCLCTTDVTITPCQSVIDPLTVPDHLVTIQGFTKFIEV